MTNQRQRTIRRGDEPPIVGPFLLAASFMAAAFLIALALFAG